jgi:hypothetical protein
LKEVSGIEKLFVTVTFLVWAENGKLPLYMILNHKAVPNEQLRSGTIVRCQYKGWMTNEIVKTYWALVWNRKQWILQREWLMFVMLDACRRRLTPWIKATVSSIITGFVIASEVMASAAVVACCGEQVVQRPPKTVVWGLGRGTCLLEVQEAQCVCSVSGFWLAVEEEGTGSFLVMQYMIYANLGRCKTFWAVVNLCYY